MGYTDLGRDSRGPGLALNSICQLRGMVVGNRPGPR